MCPCTFGLCENFDEMDFEPYRARNFLRILTASKMTGRTTWIAVSFRAEIMMPVVVFLWLAKVASEN